MTETFSYPCIVFRQRPGKKVPLFCSFAVPARDLLAWAAIRRLVDQPGAPQRIEQPARTRGVTNFLENDSRNTIPTAVLVALTLDRSSVAKLVKPLKEPSSAVSRLSFAVKRGASEQEKPGLVVDGQHRLLGINHFDPNIKINVVAMVNATDAETAFQFLVVNNKASKVSQDHIRSLALDYKNDELDTRLKGARLSLSPHLANVAAVDTETGSPFKGLIDWPSNRSGHKIVAPAAIEASLAHISNSYRDFADADVLLEFFFAIWRPVKARWPELWQKESKLLEKVGVVTLTQFLTQQMMNRFDIQSLDLSDPEAVAKATGDVIDSLSASFWKATWTGAGYDTKAGQKLVSDSLVDMYRNLRAGEPWQSELAIIDLANTPPELLSK